MVTSYRCGRLFVDSTGRKSTSALVVPRDQALGLRLGAREQPDNVELRLYPGAGVAGWFFHWPEQLSPGNEPIDTLSPLPSLTLEYLPDVPSGEYSLVVRAVWKGPVEVFFAISLILE